MAATEKSQMTKPLKLSLTIEKFVCPGTSLSHLITVCVILKELIFLLSSSLSFHIFAIIFILFVFISGLVSYLFH